MAILRLVLERVNTITPVNCYSPSVASLNSRHIIKVTAKKTLIAQQIKLDQIVMMNSLWKLNQIDS